MPVITGARPDDGTARHGTARRDAMPSDSHSTDEPLTTTQAHVGSVERSRNPRLRPPPRRETRNKANTRAARNGGLVDKGCSVVAQMPLECAAPVEMRIGNGGGKGGGARKRERGEKRDKSTKEACVHSTTAKRRHGRPENKKAPPPSNRGRGRAAAIVGAGSACLSLSLSLSFDFQLRCLLVAGS